MSNEEIVMSRLKRKAKTPIMLGIQEYYGEKVEEVPYKMKYKLSEKNEKFSVIDHVYNILELTGGYDSFTLTKRRQCRSGANRSAQDLWRLYKHYVDPNISIFEILRALYSLAKEYKRVGAQYCFTVKKIVFWPSSYGGIYCDGKTGDLGVAIENWKHIGEENYHEPVAADIPVNFYSAEPLVT